MKIAWQRWGSILAAIVCALAIGGTVIKTSRDYATKDELKESQEQQEKFLTEYIKNAANDAADKAVEKWIQRTK